MTWYGVEKCHHACVTTCLSLWCRQTASCLPITTTTTAAYLVQRIIAACVVVLWSQGLYPSRTKSQRGHWVRWMSTTMVYSLLQVEGHLMSSPGWVDRAGHVLAYRTMHSNDVALAYSMIYCHFFSIMWQVLHTPGPELSRRFDSVNI